MKSPATSVAAATVTAVKTAVEAAEIGTETHTRLFKFSTHCFRSRFSFFGGVGIQLYCCIQPRASQRKSDPYKHFKQLRAEFNQYKKHARRNCAAGGNADANPARATLQVPM